MGLLDSLDDPANSGLLSLGLRLMSTPGNFGRALGTAGLGAMGDIQAAREASMKRQVQTAQLSDIAAQAELRKQQAMKMDRIQQMIQQTMPGQSQAQPVQGASQGMPAGNPGGPGGQSSPLHGIPPEALQFDLAFNDGKGIAQEMFQRSRPNMAVHNGVVIDMNQASPGSTLPQISQNGQASQLMPDPSAPGGYRVVTPPGAVDTYKAYKTADAEVGNNNELVKVYDPTSRREIMVPKSAVLAAARPQPPVAIDQVREDLANPATKFSSPAVRAQVQRAAQVQTPMAAGPSSSEAATADAEKAYAVGSAKDIIDFKKSIMSADMSAPGKIAKLSQIGDLLKGVDGGSLTLKGMQIASAANSIGLKIDKSLPNKEAAQAIAREMALQLRDPSAGGGMPGSMSNGDREFLSSMTPDISQSAQGRQQIINAQIAVLSRQREVAQAMRNYEKKYGQVDQGFFSQLSAYAEAHPLFGGK